LDVIEERTFAYLLAASDWSEEIQATVSVSYSDTIELTMSCEDQAETAEQLWPIGWETFMGRIAPVQLTLGWDPRPYLRSVYREAGIEPLYCLRDEMDGDHILYFAQLPPEGFRWSPRARRDRDAPDRVRFDEVLAATIEIARSQRRGMLFYGGWGWSYEIDYLEDVAHVLEQAGMKFLTRHA
jgi:hypothetical protein